MQQTAEGKWERVKKGRGQSMRTLGSLAAKDAVFFKLIEREEVTKTGWKRVIGKLSKGAQLKKDIKRAVEKMKAERKLRFNLRRAAREGAEFNPLHIRLQRAASRGACYGNYPRVATD